eukprot:1380424-Amorphochlora_amoeboformis.AAC.1
MSFRSAKRVCYTRQNSTVFPTTDCNRAHEAKKERLYLKQEKEEIKQRVVRCSRARIRKKARLSDAWRVGNVSDSIIIR